MSDEEAPSKEVVLHPPIVVSVTAAEERIEHPPEDVPHSILPTLTDQRVNNAEVAPGTADALVQQEE